MAKLSSDRIEQIRDSAESYAIGAANFGPHYVESLSGHIDALTQENADLHARIAGYEQSAQTEACNALEQRLKVLSHVVRIERPPMAGFRVYAKGNIVQPSVMKPILEAERETLKEYPRFRFRLEVFPDAPVKLPNAIPDRTGRVQCFRCSRTNPDYDPLIGVYPCDECKAAK